MSSLIRATNLWGYSELVRELGGDPAVLLQRCQIPAEIETDDDAFVGFAALARLLEVSAQALECPDFGLRLARWQGLDILGPIAVIARNAQTVQDGLGAVARYLFVHSPALKLAVASAGNPGSVRFTYNVTELTLPGLRQAYELSMANAVRILRLLAGEDADFSVVSFLHDQMASERIYSEALGCPVIFGQDWCGFEIPRAFASRRIDAADSQTRELATKYLESAYLPARAGLSDRAADLARRLLPTGHGTAEAIAEELALHPRTLQRRLRAENTSCQEIIDNARRRQAEIHLAEPRLELHQIAAMLGYAEQSSLNRSCQRWFSMTPRQYRATLAGSRT